MQTDILEIFKNCSSEIKKGIITKKFKMNSKIVEQDFEVNYLYILIKGTNKIYRISETGINYLQKIINPGEIYGEVESLNNMPSMCTIEAITDCEVLMVPKEIFKRWVRIDFDFSMFIINTLSTKLYFKIQKTSNDVFYPLEYRFISLILHLYEKHNALIIPISKELLVEQLATSLRSINRIIYKLKSETLIDYYRGYIEILNVEKLKYEKERLQ